MLNECLLDIRVLEGLRKAADKNLLEGLGEATGRISSAGLGEFTGMHANDHECNKEYLDKVRQHTNKYLDEVKESTKTDLEKVKEVSRSSTRMMERPTHGFYLGSYRRE